MQQKFDPAGTFALIATVMFALFYIFNIFGWNFISGHTNYWNGQAGDIPQHISGLNLYLSSPWQFPLLGFDGLNYPQGTRVTFVDGIPIFAFFLKIFFPRDIGYINPMGYWVVLSFLLQAVSAWWIMRELQIKSWAFLAFLVLTLLTFHAFAARLVHVALMSHWIILFAIALYIRDKRLSRVSILGWSMLLFFSFYIHIYLNVMAIGIYIASAFGVKHKISVRYVFSLFLPLLFLGVSLFVFLLPLPSGHIQSPNDFNEYGTNLLAPFNGGEIIKFHANMAVQHEQSQYLGLGVILLFLWTIISSFSKNNKILKNYWTLFLIIGLFFLYSLSNQIYFGSTLVLNLDYPHFLNPIITQFRACGRFFWPVGYTILIFSLYSLYHQCGNKRIFSIIVIMLMMVQSVDLAADYQHLRSKKKMHPAESWVDYSALDYALGKRVKYIYLYPKYSCRSLLATYTFHVVTPLMKYAAMHQLKLNTGFVSRYGSDCTDMVTQIAQSNKIASAYIFSKTDFHDIENIYPIFVDKTKIVCTDIGTLYVCHFNKL